MILNSKNKSFHQQSISRFRLIVILFFLGLLIPLTLIIYSGFTQFENEMFYQYRWKASNAVEQINKTFTERLAKEQERPPENYNFYQFVKNPVNMSWQKELSPLSNPSNHPMGIGFIGYFQIDINGKLTTPLLPHPTKEEIAADNTELQWGEVERRLNIQSDLMKDLTLVGFLIKQRISIQSADVEKSWQPEISTAVVQAESKNLNAKINTIDAFQLKEIDDTKLIFYRNVWLKNGPVIQGFVVDKDKFFYKVVRDHLQMGRYENNIQLSINNNLAVGVPARFFRYDIDQSGKSSISALAHVNKTLLERKFYTSTLINPLHQITLTFSTDELPLGSASRFVAFFIILLLIIIVVGCIGFYWLGLKQIALAEQRMNFVSSVSHELKTPLTSILMYSDMLKSGMVSNDETKSEYHCFIYEESERLSRLINNILQLSNISRQQELVNMEFLSVHTLADVAVSKIDSMVRNNNFSINLTIAAELDSAEICVDIDAFAQIVINLIDNSIKFFNAANIDDVSRRKIDISFQMAERSKEGISFLVRDFGPGISASQQNKIFELFYRCGNELTRTAPGTGIGLSLVNQLVLAQDGDISILGQNEGVAFKLVFNARNIRK